MSFGSTGNTDESECRTIIHRALDAGINLIDTADVYSLGESEQIVGRAIAGRRDEVVLASKFFNPMSADDPNRRGASRRWIMKACEDSLRRLGTDHLDLYQVHRPDESTDVDETLGALSDLVRQGKVRMIGTSTFPAETIVEAQWAADRRGHTRYRSEQLPYSLLVRGAERDVLPTCQRYGMGVLVWSPLNAGWLTGKYQGADVDPQSRFSRRGGRRWNADAEGSQRKREIVGRLQAVADEAGLDLITMALAFTTAHPAVTSTIIGPRTMEQLESQLPAAGVTLDAAVMDAIDEIVAPGSTVSRRDLFFEPRAIRHAALRRR